MSENLHWILRRQKSLYSTSIFRLSWLGYISVINESTAESKTKFLTKFALIVFSLFKQGHNQFAVNFVSLWHMILRETNSVYNVKILFYIAEMYFSILSMPG